MGKIGFGAVLNEAPQMSFHPDYPELVKLCRCCEEASFSSAWLMDHLTWGPDSSVLECWTTLTALASDTSKIHLGPFFLCNSYRNPALVAKMAATLDVISKGRLELGMGAGWKKDEYAAYGYPFGTAAERIRRLDEAVTVMKLLWTGNPVTFRGTYYNVEEAICRPVQHGGPRLWIGGGGERLTLRVAAKHAEACNFSGLSTTLETFKKKSAVLEEHCRIIGRSPEEITKSITLGLVLGETSDQAHERERLAPRRLGTRFVGTPSQCISHLEKYVEAGASYFMLLIEDLIPGLDLLAEHVMPSFL